MADLAATLTVTQTTLVAALSHSSRMLGLSSSRNTSPCRVPAGLNLKMKIRVTRKDDEC